MKSFLLIVAIFASVLCWSEETGTMSALHWSISADSIGYADAFTALLIGENGTVTYELKNSQNVFDTPAPYTFTGSAGDWFYLELVNKDGDTLSVSDTYKYNDLVADGYMDLYLSDKMQPDILHSMVLPINAYHVPEPSSGLLLALGLAGLALKRKRRQA